MTSLVRKTVLAFDVGIKNMAFCLLRTGEGQTDRTVVLGAGDKLAKVEVLQLGRFSIGEWGTAQQKLVLTLCTKLNDMVFERVPDAIVVENQVASSSTLRILQFALQSYFHGRYSAVPVRFQDGDCKLKLCDLEAIKEEKSAGKNKYRLNKKYATLRTMADMRGTVWEKNMSGTQKGDDMADAYLHALFFAQYRL